MNFQKKMNEVISSNDFTGGIDINSLLTTTQPPEFILKLLIIQHREDLHYALDDYMKQKALSIKPNVSKLKARLFSLFFQMRSSLKDYYCSNKREDYFNRMEDDILNSKDFEALYKICCDIESYLYDKKLIRFDNSRQYDSTRVEVENREKRL